MTRGRITVKTDLTAMQQLATTRPLVQVVVTTCCGRDLRWLGELFSPSGWRWRPDEPLSFATLVGPHAHLLVYDKGGNQTSMDALMQRIRYGGLVYPNSASVVALPNAPGREAHTITAHMAGRVDELPPITTFIQGDMKSDHMMPLVYLHRALVNATRSSEAVAMHDPTSTRAAEAARRIVERVASRMNRAAPSTVEAALCHVGDVPPLLCEAGPNSPDFRAWPCPADFAERQRESRRPLHHLGGYTSLAGFVLKHFLGESTTPGIEVPFCAGGSLSATAEQARRGKPAAWWRALNQLLERDRKIRWVSGLRMAHVFERLWLRIFTMPAPQLLVPHDEPPRRPFFAPRAAGPSSASAVLALPRCFDEPSDTCCTSPTECCCPMRPPSYLPLGKSMRPKPPSASDHRRLLKPRSSVSDQMAEREGVPAASSASYKRARAWRSWPRGSSRVRVSGGSPGPSWGP